MNARPGRVRRWACAASLAGAAVATGLLTVGVLASDRWHATQYVAWMPRWVVLLGLALACLAWGALARRPRVRRAGVMLAGLLAAWVVVGEWRLYRVVRPSPGGGAARILVWNPAWENMSAFHARVLEVKPDVFFCANPHPNADWVKLREQFGGPTYTLRQGTLVVVSRYPIRRFAWLPLGITPEPHRPTWWPVPKTSSAGGEALCVTLDVPGFEGGLTAWFLDTPSDAWAARRRVMGEAAGAIAAFRGPFMTRDDGGRDVPEEALRLGQLLPNGGFEARPDATAPKGFPQPDLLVGDLNTPAGCWSVTQLAPGLRDAFADAGVGPMGTFPREAPLLHIDHARLGRRVKAVRYETVDFGASRHLGQVVEVVPAAR